ncbi:hypothetical protein KI387_030004, partial [Taxus chinensis]
LLGSRTLPEASNTAITAETSLIEAGKFAPIPIAPLFLEIGDIPNSQKSHVLIQNPPRPLQIKSMSHSSTAGVKNLVAEFSQEFLTFISLQIMSN